MAPSTTSEPSLYSKRGANWRVYVSLAEEPPPLLSVATLFTLPVGARVAITVVRPSPPTVERPLLTFALSLAATQVKLRFQNSPSK